MTNEQREAIELVEYIADNTWTTKYIMSSDSKKADTVLSLIKEKDKIINEQLKEIVKLQKELNEENKRCMILANNDKFKEQVIDLIVKELWGEFYLTYMNGYGINSKEELKQYFAGLVEKE